VSAADVGPRVVELARLNAQRYQADNIEFKLLTRGEKLPYEPGFDLITCNSVLEYVLPEELPQVMQELDRVLKPGGLLLVLGTSNRLSPREVHSRRWLSNYLPRPVDRLLGFRQRGIFPWAVRGQLAGYRDVVAADRGEKYFDLRKRLGDPAAKLTALYALAKLGSVFGLSAGEVTPSFLQVLQKPG
jgi:SAM-dependent methyltransferase